MALAQLVFHEDGSITAREVIKADHIELAWDFSRYSEEQVQDAFEKFMSVIFEKPVKLEKVGQDQAKSFNKSFEVIGNPMELNGTDRIKKTNIDEDV